MSKSKQILFMFGLSMGILEKNNIAVGTYCLYHLYLPGYEDINKAATVWVIRNKNGTINIISNN